MPFISISIDICGSTAAKAQLLEHSKCIDTEATHFYEEFQKQILRVETTFWTILQSSNLEIERLFLIKSIGDEVWYAYSLDKLNEYEILASISHIIRATIALQTKHFDVVVGPPENPFDWENQDPNEFLRIELPLKITVELITDALDISIVREKYLSPHVVSLLSPLGTRAKPILAGNESYINLCNRLGISTQHKTEDKVLSSVRTDYIGWEIDRFFRVTKEAVRGAVLIGPAILATLDRNDLLPNIGQEDLNKNNLTVNDVSLRVCTGPASFISFNTYVLARKKLLASELKGVGSDCDVGIINYKHR
jgi:hypothetical protein